MESRRAHLEDGALQNAFGLDPFVVGQTLEEVNKCKRAGS